MPTTNSSTAVNRLIAALPGPERQRFMAGCEPITLTFGEMLAEPGTPLAHVYFPTESFLSLTTMMNKGSRLGVMLVGDEGMMGFSLLLGVDLPLLHASVLGPGQALRMETAPFCRELKRSAAWQHLLKRYLYVMLGQLAQAAACNRFHLLEARLARWLLLAQDRAHSDCFHVTHELLAQILGVRRVGITKAASMLQRRKLIRYHRGDIRILDRGGLEASACSCLRLDQSLYAQFLESTR
ncbi:Crp/Fnr family transcriptional regulator [Marinobacterium lutimaris]|uniref:cAMP-binding domain of CRP or a regulatory subunit of cAMP-dependent protein kinases n=1 Tax=Marinobacterium lutimaris TaxID=568106 RepID=A0A1H6DUH2_9GAMM|nr:Crp/Fnr family transcriptional regulator [Marinobacterium lutimaris]SEG88694.1 cAMP-binding domain of CRP or a regulatory subunit of cAMP-dependent protein kinases [Marinobacterium lutimaris]